MDSLTFLSKFLDASLTAFAEVVKGVAWPIAVLVIAFRFRGPLVKALGRLTKLSLPGGVEVELGQKLTEAEETEKKVVIPPVEDPEEVAKAVEKAGVGDLTLPASPPAIITGMWHQLNKTALEIADAQLGPEEGWVRDVPIMRRNTVFDTLYANGLMTEDERKLLAELREINFDVTGERADPSLEDAARFRAMAERLILAWVVRQVSAKPKT